MKILAGLVSVALVVLGLIFLVAASDSKTVPRIIAGGAMIAGGAAVGAFVARSGSRQGAGGGSIEQHLDLSGDVSLEQMSCRQCGGALSAKNVEVRAGAVFVKCPYCSAEYQIEEKPRW